MRRLVAALVAVVVLVAAWSPLIAPLGRAGIVVLDVYSSALYGSNWAAAVTPEPRVSEARIRIAGEDVRVTWWVPGAAERHPAMLLVNGATALGNDDPETRRISEALARAGYVVMLPQLSFLTEARLAPTAPATVDAAFAALLERGDVDTSRAGAFGFSVGGGVLLAAAGMPGASLARARYLGALGAYFDIRTYLASVVSGMRPSDGGLVPWTPDPEARLKLPRGAAEALGDAGDRATLGEALTASGGVLAAAPPDGLGDEARALWLALAAPSYDDALARLDALPPRLRETFASLSPATHWRDIAVPVFWLHDDEDRFEPVSEAEHAAATPHRADTDLHRTHLLSHAAALGQGARDQGPGFWARELGGLLGFALDVLRRAG